MKRFSLLAVIVLSTAALAQQPQPPAKGPQLSTADKVAINTFEKAKQDAMKAYNDAQQAEQTVLQEWAAGHPGWQINPQTYNVEHVVALPANASTPTPKGAPKQ